VQISVDDPDDVFGDANTIYASNDADFTGVPVGVPAGNKIITSSANAAWLLQASPRRILYKGGDEFTWDGGVKSGVGKTFIGSWGTGRAILNSGVAGSATAKRGPGFKDSFTQLVMKDIIVKGSYNMATQTPVSRDAAGIGTDINENAVGTITYDNVKAQSTINGFGTPDQMNERPGSAIAYLDCEVDQWLDYGIGSNGYYLGAFHGCWVHAPLDAAKYAGGPRDTDLTGPISSGGAAYRIQTVSALDAGAADGGFGSFTHFSGCDGFSNYAGKFDGDQPVYKIAGKAVHGARFNVDRMITEGSTTTNYGTGLQASDIQDGIYDRYIHIGTAQCGVHIGIQCAGTTMRNCFFKTPHVEFEKKSFKDGINEFSILLNSAGSPAENVSGPIEIYGCTNVLWMTRFQGEHEDNTPYYLTEQGPDTWESTRIVSNNITHAPFWGQVAEVDTSVALTGMEGIYPGQKPTPGSSLNTAFATPETFTHGGYTDQPTVCEVIPEGANLTVTTGNKQKVPVRYIDGTLRGASPAKGAFAP
jgi:hypothetical protein